MINSAAHNNRTRTHIPDQMTIKRWLSLSLFVLRILTDYSDASFSLDDFALFANRFYWWSNFHVKPSFQKRPSYIIAWRSFLCKRILTLFSIFFRFFQLFCDLFACFTIKTIRILYFMMCPWIIWPPVCSLCEIFQVDRNHWKWEVSPFPRLWNRLGILPEKLPAAGREQGAKRRYNVSRDQIPG